MDSWKKLPESDKTKFFEFLKKLSGENLDSSNEEKIKTLLNELPSSFCESDANKDKLKQKTLDGWLVKKASIKNSFLDDNVIKPSTSSASKDSISFSHEKTLISEVEELNSNFNSSDASSFGETKIDIVENHNSVNEELNCTFENSSSVSCDMSYAVGQRQEDLNKLDQIQEVGTLSFEGSYNCRTKKYPSQIDFIIKNAPFHCDTVDSKIHLQSLVESLKRQEDILKQSASANINEANSSLNAVNFAQPAHIMQTSHGGKRNPGVQMSLSDVKDDCVSKPAEMALEAAPFQKLETSKYINFGEQNLQVAPALKKKKRVIPKSKKLGISEANDGNLVQPAQAIQPSHEQEKNGSKTSASDAGLETVEISFEGANCFKKHKTSEHTPFVKQSSQVAPAVLKTIRKNKISAFLIKRKSLRKRRSKGDECFEYTVVKRKTSKVPRCLKVNKESLNTQKVRNFESNQAESLDASPVLNQAPLSVPKQKSSKNTSKAYNEKNKTSIRDKNKSKKNKAKFFVSAEIPVEATLESEVVSRRQTRSMDSVTPANCVTSTSNENSSHHKEISSPSKGSFITESHSNNCGLKSERNQEDETLSNNELNILISPSIPEQKNLKKHSSASKKCNLSNSVTSVKKLKNYDVVNSIVADCDITKTDEQHLPDGETELPKKRKKYTKSSLNLELGIKADENQFLEHTNFEIEMHCEKKKSLNDEQNSSTSTTKKRGRKKLAHLSLKNAFDSITVSEDKNEQTKSNKQSIQIPNIVSLPPSRATFETNNVPSHHAISMDSIANSNDVTSKSNENSLHNINIDSLSNSTIVIESNPNSDSDLKAEENQPIIIQNLFAGSLPSEKRGKKKLILVSSENSISVDLIKLSSPKNIGDNLEASSICVNSTPQSDNQHLQDEVVESSGSGRINIKASPNLEVVHKHDENQNITHQNLETRKDNQSFSTSLSIHKQSRQKKRSFTLENLVHPVTSASFPKTAKRMVKNKASGDSTKSNELSEQNTKIESPNRSKKVFESNTSSCYDPSTEESQAVTHQNLETESLSPTENHSSFFESPSVPKQKRGRKRSLASSESSNEQPLEDKIKTKKTKFIYNKSSPNIKLDCKTDQAVSQQSIETGSISKRDMPSNNKKSSFTPPSITKQSVQKKNGLTSLETLDNPMISATFMKIVKKGKAMVKSANTNDNNSKSNEEPLQNMEIKSQNSKDLLESKRNSHFDLKTEEKQLTPQNFYAVSSSEKEKSPSCDKQSSDISPSIDRQRSQMKLCSVTLNSIDSICSMASPLKRKLNNQQLANNTSNDLQFYNAEKISEKHFKDIDFNLQSITNDAITLKPNINFQIIDSLNTNREITVTKQSLRSHSKDRENTKSKVEITPEKICSAQPKSASPQKSPCNTNVYSVLKKTKCTSEKNSISAGRTATVNDPSILEVKDTSNNAHNAEGTCTITSVPIKETELEMLNHRVSTKSGCQASFVQAIPQKTHEKTIASSSYPEKSGIPTNVDMTNFLSPSDSYTTDSGIDPGPLKDSADSEDTSPTITKQKHRVKLYKMNSTKGYKADGLKSCTPVLVNQMPKSIMSSIAEKNVQQTYSKSMHLTVKNINETSNLNNSCSTNLPSHQHIVPRLHCTSSEEFSSPQKLICLTRAQLLSSQKTSEHNTEAYHKLSENCKQLGLQIDDILSISEVQSSINNNTFNDFIVFIGCQRDPAGKILPIVHVHPHAKKLHNLLKESNGIFRNAE